MKRRLLQLAAATLVIVAAIGLLAQAPPPPDAPEVVDYQKLVPVLPEAPSGWTADQAEGQTAGGLTNVHRDYKKGEGENSPIASISILDLAGNPEAVASTKAGWKLTNEAPDGYTKPVTVDGNPGQESAEKDSKHAALRLLIAERYLLAIESTLR